MRKNLLITGLTIMFLFTGCGEADTPQAQTKMAASQTQTVNDVLMERMEEKKPSPTKAPTPIEAEEATVTESVSEDVIKEAAGVIPDLEQVDVDLTTLSATLVYSEVYNMMTNPSSYEGKVVKMKGLFSLYQDEATGNEYYACIIRDATACCAQGIEFKPETAVYPDDFPNEGEEVMVVGVFDTYMEGEYLYCTLRNAQLL